MINSGPGEVFRGLTSSSILQKENLITHTFCNIEYKSPEEAMDPVPFVNKAGGDVHCGCCFLTRTFSFGNWSFSWQWGPIFLCSFSNKFPHWVFICCWWKIDSCSRVTSCICCYKLYSCVLREVFVFAQIVLYIFLSETEIRLKSQMVLNLIYKRVNSKLSIFSNSKASFVKFN